MQALPFRFGKKEKKNGQAAAEGRAQAYENETGGKTAGKVIRLEGWHTDPQGAKKKNLDCYTPNN